MITYDGYIKGVTLNGFLKVTGFVDNKNNEQDRLIFLKDVYVSDEDRWSYREFMRKNFLKKKVKWNFEGAVTLATSGDNLTKVVLEAGWARVKGKIEELRKISDEAKKKGLGVFNSAYESRITPTSGSQEFNRKLYENAKKPLLCIVEEVINCTLYKVTIIADNKTVYVQLDGLQGWGTDPSYNFITSDDQYKLQYKFIESKKLAEFVVLGREVGLQVSGLDKSGNLIGMLMYSRNDMYKLYNELIVMGAAKLTTFSNTLPIDVRIEFEQRQNDAQSEKVMIWKSLEASSDEVLTGTVMEIWSGDTLSVHDEITDSVTRLNLAGVRAPNMGGNNSEQEPWAAEAKEFLIKVALGKKVSCNVEFKRTTQNGNTLIFATIVVNGQQENLSVQVVQAGFGSIVNSRENEPEINYSIRLKNLYKEANEAEVGMHKDPYHSVPKYIDLTDKQKFSKYSSTLVPNKSKMGQAVVMTKIDGFIDLVIAPNKLRVRLIKENYLINLFLAGVNSISNDQNSAEFQMYNKSLIYTKKKLMQRYVKIEIENYDKYGNFFGYISQDKDLFNESILKAGYGHLSNNSGKIRILEKAHDHAKSNELGLFSLKLYKISELLTPKKGTAYYFSDVFDPNLFYVREDSNYCSELENNLKESIQISVSGKLQNLQKPFKKQNYCLTFDEETEDYYRAKILSTAGDKVELLLIDHGTYMCTDPENLFQLHSRLYKIPQLAIPVVLYGVRMPGLEEKGSNKCLDWLSETLSGHKNLYFDSDYKKMNSTTGFNAILYHSSKNRDQGLVGESLNNAAIAGGFGIVLNESEKKGAIDVLKGSLSIAIRDNIGMWSTGELAVLEDDY